MVQIRRFALHAAAFLIAAIAALAFLAPSAAPAAYGAEGSSSLTAGQPVLPSETEGDGADDKVTEPVAPQPVTAAVYSLRNPKSGDRIYTVSIEERDKCRRAGWVYGGSSWTAPVQSKAPVYRLYKPGYGHYFTANKSEYAKMLKQRWRDQGIAFYMPDYDQPRIAVYRDASPKKTKMMNYFLTGSASKHNSLLKSGWKSKGVFYGVPTAAQLRNGWVRLSGKWQYMKNGVAVKSRWVVTSNNMPAPAMKGKQRYWIDSKGTLACGRLINPKKAADKKAGYYAYARSTGAVVCGTWYNGKNRCYVATKAGKLPTKGGWLTTKKYAGSSQRYRIDGKTHAAMVGKFKVGKSYYYGYKGKGYIVRNDVVKVNGKGYWASAKGVLHRDSQVYRLVKKAQGYASDTRYLIMIDIDDPRFILLQGSKGNWKIRNVWECDTGAPSTPTIRGVYKMGIKGYSFGHGYTCYYYSQILGDYLIHTRIYQEGTWIMNDGPLGRRCSQGCVRLATGNAKWVWDNVPSGTTIVTTT